MAIDLTSLNENVRRFFSFLSFVKFSIIFFETLENIAFFETLKNIKSFKNHKTDTQTCIPF